MPFDCVLTIDPTYMHRCLQVASLGEGQVAPNPMVGAVLVYNDQIIGEGYHKYFGGPHAEVECINSVHPDHQYLIEKSVLYVSLEPCAHFGKTPPCASLIIQKDIKQVVIGCRDPFEQVNGKGIEQLQAAGVEVKVGLLEEECRHLNKRFFIFHQKKRPYVFLKWAQSADQKIARSDKSRVLISNAYTNRLVHHWRSQYKAILVGTNTALHDDPALTTRWWPGKHPLRLVVDLQLRLPASLQLFSDGLPTIVFNWHRHTITESGSKFNVIGVQYYRLSEGVSIIDQLVQALYQMEIQSLMVEGGAQLLQSFLSPGCWDEAAVITNTGLVIGEGLFAPMLNQARATRTEVLYGDSIQCYQNLSN